MIGGSFEQHHGPWTVDDVLALDEDRRYRYELLGESLVMSPAPGLRHQRASRRLANFLEAAALVAGAPVEVFEAVNVTLPSGLVVPDIVVADAGATGQDGASINVKDVLLVVELVSPGNATMDRRFRPMLYAEAGIPAYWRLEADPDPVLVISELRGGRYIKRTTALAGAVTHVDVPFPFEIDPAGLARQ
ncbi:Putative restriction endonuclease [Actinacidiphila yanglinensis]|uniref:Putative restriction endonuclease n=1 Tax=Actinacidiphila yanglinensis TaxID=310779 RepID=A0A1H6EC07_9ACTN|nr:Uma2 family endonuclease [Actinacidiphila yanglinensis]SEG94811.1 Putative restriction endonuclease [Actinacidiphila yanglinensis]